MADPNNWVDVEPYQESDHLEPILSGTRYKMRRCPMCIWYARTIIDWNAHAERHFCEDCSKYCHPIKDHNCPTPGLMGGHVDANAAEAVDESVFQEYSRSNLGIVKTYRHTYVEDFVDIGMAFQSVSEGIVRLLTELIAIHGALTVSFVMAIDMERQKDDFRREVLFFPSNDFRLFDSAEIQQFITEGMGQIQGRRNKFLTDTSTWKIIKILTLDIIMGEYRLLERIRPHGYLPIPDEIGEKSGYISFRNTDNRCFQLCVVCAVFRDQWEKQHKGRVGPRYHENYKVWEPYIGKLDFSAIGPDGIDFYRTLPLVEAVNDIAVNVFSHVRDKIVLVRCTRMKRYKKLINLFVIYTPDRKKSHVVLITNLDRFLGHIEIKKHTFFCPYCILRFSSENSRTKHIAKCRFNDKEGYEFPPSEENLKFRRWELTLPMPFTLFYDFEALTLPVEESDSHNGKNTTLRSRFEPIAFSLVIVQRTNNDKVELYHAEYHQGPDIMRKFFKQLFFWSNLLARQIRKTNNRIVPTAQQLKHHYSQRKCQFCEIEFDDNFVTDEEADVSYKDPEIDSLDVTELYDYTDDEKEDQEDEKKKERKASAKQAKGKRGKVGATKQEESVQEEEAGPSNKIPRLSKADQRVKTNVRTYHHNHFSGEYLATLCAKCNAKCRYQYEIPAYAHAASSFDLHFLLSRIEDGRDYFDIDKSTIIAKSTEKVIQLTLTDRNLYLPPLVHTYGSTERECFDSYVNRGRRNVSVRLCDSYQFLGCSLYDASMTCYKQKDPYLTLLSQARHALAPGLAVEDDAYNLLFYKLPYPYKALNSEDMLKPGVAIPSRAEFRNDLTEEDVTDKEWDRLQQVIEKFHIKDFAQLTRLYCLTDSLLLAISFEALRRDGLKSYGLDCAYMATMPGFSWQSWLYTSKSEVCHLRNREMISFLTANLRGGIAQSCAKYCQANTPYHPPSYDKNKETVHLLSVDINALYSYCLTMDYPVSDYEWVSGEELSKIDWTDPDLGMKTGYGYILELDLLYDEEAQKRTMQLPLMPHKACVKYEDLSVRQQAMSTSLGAHGKSITTTPKLLLTCFDRERYGLHYRTLLFYLRMGIKIKSIIRGIRFREKPIFRDYVQSNIDQRISATSETVKKMKKGVNNSLFGRCLMSARNFLQVKLVETGTHARAYLASSRLHSFKPLTRRVSIVCMRPKKIVFSEMIQCGFTVLDLAKWVFYEKIFLELMEQTFPGNRVTLYQVDTDGAYISVRDPEGTFHADIVRSRHFYDLSKLNAEHEIFKEFAHIKDLRTLNAGKCGKWKIECTNILSICCVRPKQFSVLFFEDGTFQVFTDIKLKGATLASRKRQVTHEIYVKTVFDDTYTFHVTNHTIRSYNHTIYTVVTKRMAFHGLDVYRVYPNPDDINESYPFGYYDIPQKYLETK